MYLYEDPKWPHFYYDINCCLDLLNAIFLKYGLLLGKITSIKTEDLDLDKLHTNSLADEIVCSSQIEGEFLDRNAILESINVRFSNSFNVPSSAQYEDGIVAMMLDATENFDNPLTCERLCAWQEKLFTREYVGFYKIVVGALDLIDKALCWFPHKNMAKLKSIIKHPRHQIFHPCFLNLLLL